MDEEDFDMGVGAVSVFFPGTNDIYVISLMNWVPNDTTNTMSPGEMKLLSGFNITLVEPLEYCDFIGNSRNIFSCATTVKIIWTT